MKMHRVRLKKTANSIVAVLFVLFVFLPLSCRKAYTPRPRGYYRISFPEKSYKHFQSDCKFTFDVPVYSDVLAVTESYAEPCWYNINFSRFNASIYLTYKPLNNDLASHM
jgi:gliding motility-associated lipoprotein GldD